jgi:hypothetical protein
VLSRKRRRNPKRAMRKAMARTKPAHPRPDVVVAMQEIAKRSGRCVVAADGQVIAIARKTRVTERTGAAGAGVLRERLSGTRMISRRINRVRLAG